MYTLYGIKNCDTVKKAKKWLEQNEIAYHFHDYRSDGLDSTLLQILEAQFGWENLLNKRSTSWRQIDESLKNNLDKSTALQLMLDTPTLIKRPAITGNNIAVLGFSADKYQTTL